MRKRWQSLIALFSIFLLAGCAKRIAQDELVNEVEIGTEIESSTERPRFIYAGVQGSDETGFLSYNLYPTKNEIDIELVGDTEADWRTYTAELVSFSESDDGLEFTYLNEEGKAVEKSFKILSQSIVIDEENNRYEW